MNRKLRFLQDFEDTISPSYLVVAVQLPNGAIELITNNYNLAGKMEYYANAYDKDLRLNANPEIRIVNWMVV